MLELFPDDTGVPLRDAWHQVVEVCALPVPALVFVFVLAVGVVHVVVVLAQDLVVVLGVRVFVRVVELLVGAECR